MSTTRKRRTLTTEFKLESAKLVLDQGYTISEACQAIGIGEKVLRRWVAQLQQERSGTTPAVDTERLLLRSEVARLFNTSRCAAGSRTLALMMNELSYNIGRYKVRSLMQEAALVSKQPGAHRYKPCTEERPDIPNRLDRQFDVEAPNRVWCGDITYV